MRETFLYVFGLMILTLGIALTILSKLGTSPFDALLVGLYRTIGLTIGSWEIIVGLAMVLLNAAAQKRMPEFLALLTSLVTGMGIDGWMFLLNDWVAPGIFISQTICLALGLILMGLGIAIYLQADYAPNPFDRTMLVVSDLTGFNIMYSRAIISVVLLFLAFVFDGSIGIGTLLNAFLSGVIINFFMSVIEKMKRDRRPVTKELS
ncbi:YczE/YyaS/YitT family protein [Tuberibacillus sp. Marseille-P3662]|uniref:YczE/YyaS/YitT family protein n=1 Tax=Tuberibacillus sp. Marseille-P3662 TaxID=1965358 RepID=UPI000A1C8F48|nr:hypothetical protein [Tuberibacillus sp. Marseille-P3662]